MLCQNYDDVCTNYGIIKHLNIQNYLKDKKSFLNSYFLFYYLFIFISYIIL